MLNRDFSKSKKIYLAKNKWTLIGIGVVLLIGILIAGIFGFNRNPDYVGCNMVNVNIGETVSDSDFDDYNSKLNTVFASNDLNLYSVQLKGEGAETTLEIKYTGKSNDTKIADVNSQIANELKVDISKISAHKKVSATVDSTDYVYAVLAGLLILVFASIFVAIRHNMSYAICTLGAGAFSVLAMLCTYAILRLEIGASFMFVVVASMVFTIFEALIWFENMRDVRKNKEYKDDLNKHLTLGLKNTNKQLQFTSISLFSVGLIFVIFGTKLSRNIALSFMFAIVIALVSLMFVLPFIYNLTVDKVKFRPFVAKNKKDNKKEVSPSKKMEEKPNGEEKTVEVVENTTNNSEEEANSADEEIVVEDEAENKENE